MHNGKGYGLIEVLVSLSIFLAIITNVGALIGKVLMQARQAEELHIVMQSVMDLNEQLYMLRQSKADEKRQLISLWQKDFQQRAPEYGVEVLEQATNMQVIIKQQKFELVLNIPV